MFFVDSGKAMAEQRSEQRPTGDFGRLLDLLSSELGASKRVEIRRANLIDLLQEALIACRSDYDAALPHVEALIETLDQQRLQIKNTLTKQAKQPVPYLDSHPSAVCTIRRSHRTTWCYTVRCIPH